MQYTEQTEERIIRAALANVGTIVTLRLGAVDAEILSKDYGGVFGPSDLMNLGLGQVHLKMPIEGGDE